MDHVNRSGSGTSIEHFNKENLVDSQGRTYKEFKNTLKPRWIALWSQLLLGHFVLIITAFGIIKVDGIIFILPLTIAIGAFIFGFTHAYIQLFFHEAAHGNIAKNRKLNDFLANVLLGIFVGQDIKAYRPIHFRHHLKIGTIEDPERNYFNQLNMRFIIESLIGIRVIKILMYRKKIKQAPDKTTQKKLYFNKYIFSGILLHSAIISIAVLSGHLPLALAWLIGIGIILPFFAAVRPLLEHRDINAKSDIDYHIIPHGSINRLFGNSLLARTLGGAGFNRHLLHHWEPQLSYTQLEQLEKFLLQTEAANFICSQQTSYLKTLKELMRSS
jgi:fatty acid desaturase